VGGRDPLWLPIANVLAWTVIFGLVALWGVRRSRART
jgi:ABC-2 type transport system permease protein